MENKTNKGKMKMRMNGEIKVGSKVQVEIITIHPDFTMISIWKKAIVTKVRNGMNGLTFDAIGENGINFSCIWDTKICLC